MRHKKNITLNPENITAHSTGKAKIIILGFIIIMLSFTNITLCLSNISNTSALSYQTDVGVSFTFNPTLSVSISSNDLVISNLTPGTTDISNEISINVSTNNIYGYNLYATVGNSAYNNTNLTRSISNDTFTSISTNADLPSLTTDNTWGYTYSLDNGTTWSNYNGLSLYTADNPTRLRKNTGPAEDTVNFKIAAKSSATQPSGAYTNVINFIAITKPTPVTLADAYASEGKELYHGYYKMQDMTHTICEEVEDIGTQLQVIDIRDDKVYWVSKLADNNCWMTQNLDLDLTSDPNADSYIALTSENTDLTDTIAYNNLNSTTWADSTTHPYSYDYLDSNGNPVYPDSNVSQQTAGNHGLSGNYYNWPAAIASNDNIGTSSNFSNSVCPSNWRLPYRYDSNDFTSLFEAYSNKIAKMSQNPLWFIRSGMVDGGAISLSGRGGYSWTATWYNSSSAFSLFFDGYGFYPANFSMSYGYPIRCLAR